MQAGIWIKYLFGQSDAIRRIAVSRDALWTGIALVLLTAIARNYDQTLLAENPFLWIFGPLLFSLVSGTWLYAIVYAGFARREMSAPGDPKPAEDGGWLSFMGLFWMTAPVAWLYAIPVERFLDSISATHANVALLSLVSLWRVVLMTRVMQVTTKAPFLNALVWVLFAASVEVLVVFFFGGGFAKAIIRGMGGMRNSPEEEILLRAMNNAFGTALWLAPITLVVALAWRPKQLLQPLPRAVAGPMSWGGLAVAACFWIAVAVIPQRELANNISVERFMANGRMREALDFLATHQPGDFAPARPLPPKPFERSIFEELPACFADVKPSDPAWVRALIFSRLDDMVSHLRNPWRRSGVDITMPRAKQIQDVSNGLTRFGPEAADLLKLLDGLRLLPEGEGWLETNTVFTEAIWSTITGPERYRYRGSKTEEHQQVDWLALSNRFHSLSLTNVTLDTTNALPAP